MAIGIKSSYPPHSTGADILMYEGPAEITEAAKTYPVQARTKITFSPSPKSTASVEGEYGPQNLTGPADDKTDQLWLKIGATDESYGMFATSEHHGWSRETGSSYSAEILLVEQDLSVAKVSFDSVVFALTSFPDFWWKAGVSQGDVRPLEIEFGDWKLVIEDVSDGEERTTSERQRSYYVTHLAEMKRADSKPMTPSEWGGVFDFLFKVLGFLAGKPVGPLLVEGRDANGAIVWRDQAMPKVGHARFHAHWFPRPYPTHIAQLVANAWNRWQDPDQREALERSIEWYWESVDRELIIETRLVLAQVGLELLSWVIMVDEGKRLSAGGFKVLAASDRISLLANQLQAATHIPAHLKELASEATSEQWTSAPQAVAEIRNKIIHPEKKGRAKIAKWDWEVKHQAAEWAVWLVEMGILWLLGYEGRYDSRVADQNQGFPFVPWIDPSQVGAPGDATA